MRFRFATVLISLSCAATSMSAQADDDKVRTALGAAAGAAAGAIIGGEVAGRDGAIAGAAIGGAAGAAVTSSPESDHSDRTKTAKVSVYLNDGAKAHPRTRHCPPGQAKKGRC